MAKADKYSIRDFKKQFPDDMACLDFLFDSLHTRECSCGGTYKHLTGYKKYQCSKCRHRISPTAGTIFHKSDTPLTLWSHAIFIFSNAKSGISAKEMERQLGVTYKTAWRILTRIRAALKQGKDPLQGDVEIDAAYFGGKKKAGKNNERLSEAVEAKAPVIGAVQRQGTMRVQVTPSLGKYAHADFMEKNIQKEGTRLMTDSSTIYKNTAIGFDRHQVDHHKKEYVRGDVPINNIERFWSHAKRSIKGTHKVISKKYLQAYLDGFVFHYDNRHNDNARFSVLLGALLSASN